jgi:hypothetical protein
MEDVANYRALVLQALRGAFGAEGQPLLTEAQAVALVNELSDAELLDGMPFNTPEEVAELLLESGLE